MDRQVTAVILAGGRGSRMGGADKGLQAFRGRPLVEHALLRLQQQCGKRLAACMVNANRNLEAYAALGVPVWPDQAPDDFAGPLAGFLTGLEHCPSPWLLTVPCDSPWFPLDLLERLGAALDTGGFDIAMACAPDEPGGRIRPQPVFCLVGCAVLPGLRAFMEGGGRKIDAWTSTLRCAMVPFDLPGDEPAAFCNVNTLPELRALEH